MLVTIDVLAEDITEGIGCDKNYCMVARAVHRVISKYAFPEISVYDTLKIYHLTKGIVDVSLPLEVQKSINDFDDWKEGINKNIPEPFSFQIDIPVEFLRIKIPKFERALATV
jgi:hypothetical protein